MIPVTMIPWHLFAQKTIFLTEIYFGKIWQNPLKDLKTSCTIFFFIWLPYWFILKWKFNPCPQNYILRNFITNFCLLFIKIILNLPQGCTNEITSPQSRKILALTNKNDSTIIKQISDAKHSRTEYINTVIHWACESKTFSFILLAQ